ncbi:MAG: DevR family CRISPR-associated autoregulator [Acidilobaceae archaeon]|nr:DevR family CRISPR-associated autoregulator [Acidilobaceae archaeon]MDW7973661.1 DevR family CRISPR-associated autoregulator [Sulfolobales archaeon]
MVAVVLKPSDRVTLSLSARVLINAEALNMAETVGNVSRHRKAPVVVPDKQGQGYYLFYVPAVSGESIAHHFQKTFVSIAKAKGLQVPKLEEQGYFLKYASEEVLRNHYPEIKTELDNKMAELYNKKKELEEKLKKKLEEKLKAQEIDIEEKQEDIKGAVKEAIRKEINMIILEEKKDDKYIEEVIEKVIEKAKKEAKEAKNKISIVESQKKGRKRGGGKPKGLGELVKEAIQEAIEEAVERISMCKMERVLVGRNAVADVAGFFFTGEGMPGLKRVSRIHFSYLIPALETVEQGVVNTQSQIHVRYSPQAKEGEQALFYVEGSSALYTLSVVFVASDVGKLEYCIDESSSETQGGSSQEEAKKEEEREKIVDQKEAEREENERKNRVEAALDALLVLLDSMTFGAKRARYLPHWQYDSIVATVSKGPVDFVVSPASNPHYIQETVNRAKSIKGVFENISIFVYARNPDSVKHLQQEPGVTVYNTPTDVLAAAANKVRELMGIAPQVP